MCDRRKAREKPCNRCPSIFSSLIGWECGASFFLRQSFAKLLAPLHAFDLRCDWFIWLLASVVIGWNVFVFWFHDTRSSGRFQICLHWIKVKKNSFFRSRQDWVSSESRQRRNLQKGVWNYWILLQRWRRWWKAHAWYWSKRRSVPILCRCQSACRRLPVINDNVLRCTNDLTYCAFDCAYFGHIMPSPLPSLSVHAHTTLKCEDPSSE